MQYEDFVVSIEAISSRAYRVAVLHSRTGEAQETVTFPFVTVALQLHLTRLENVLLKSGGSHRRMPGKEEKAALAFGQALFNFLMHGEVGQRYASQRQTVLGSGRFHEHPENGGDQCCQPFFVHGQSIVFASARFLLKGLNC
ncbi:MAG: hypothetical protein IPH82_20755 [Chloroflexi bacterium]|nr:hypothetical protein [Chloroflexota bacterium]